MSREVMVATMIMASSSREAMAVNNRVGMEVISSLAMEHPLRIRARTSSQSLDLDHSSSDRGFGVQGALSKGVGEVLVEARLHLASTLGEHSCQLTLL